MYYEASDFLETADSDTLKQIARTRELTREYYFSDYGDMENALPFFGSCWGELGKMWQSTHLFIVIMEKYFFGK